MFERKISWQQILFGVLVLSIGIELLFFSRMPKQTWIEGLMHSWYMSKGLVIYRDFASQYLPSLFTLMLVLHKFTGFSQYPTIILSPVNSIISLFIIYFLSKKYLKSWYQIAPILFFTIWDVLINENHFHTNSFLGTVNLVAFAIWIEWYQKPTKVKSIFLGVVGSVAFLAQQILVVFYGIIFISAAYKVWQNKKNIWPVVYLGISFALPIVLMFLYLLINDAWTGFYFWNYDWYAKGYYTFDKIGRGKDEILLLFSVSSPFIFLILALGKSAYSKIFSKDLIIFILLLIISFPVMFWYATFHLSRLAMCLTLFSFVFGVGLQLLMQGKKRSELTFLLLIVFVILNLFTYITVAMPRHMSNWQRPLRQNILTAVRKEDSIYEAIEWIKLNTSESEKIFVLDNPIVYLETNRLPSSPRAVSNLPFVYEPIEDFKRELVSNPPDYWLIDINQWKRFEQFGYKNTAILFGKILSCEEKVISFGDLEIYRHKDTDFCF